MLPFNFPVCQYNFDFNIQAARQFHVQEGMVKQEKGEIEGKNWDIYVRHATL